MFYEELHHLQIVVDTCLQSNTKNSSTTCFSLNTFMKSQERLHHGLLNTFRCTYWNHLFFSWAGSVCNFCEYYITSMTSSCCTGWLTSFITCCTKILKICKLSSNKKSKIEKLQTFTPAKKVSFTNTTTHIATQQVSMTAEVDHSKCEACHLAIPHLVTSPFCFCFCFPLCLMADNTLSRYNYTYTVWKKTHSALPSLGGGACPQCL